jgi:hypothetical protein
MSERADTTPGIGHRSVDGSQVNRSLKMLSASGAGSPGSVVNSFKKQSIVKQGDVSCSTQITQVSNWFDCVGGFFCLFCALKRHASALKIFVYHTLLRLLPVCCTEMSVTVLIGINAWSI